MKQRYHKPSLVTGINITPLTDIALSLLLIFMVTTPMMMQSSIKIDLPDAQSGESNTKQGIFIVINKDGDVYLDDRMINIEDLAVGIEAKLMDDPDTPIIINGDKDVEYDRVMQVLDIARKSGAKKFSLGIETLNN